jgi:hypothetical protein
LVLLEVASHHVVLTEAGAAIFRLFVAHDQPQQGRLASAVGPDKGDAVTPLHLQFSAQKQDLLAVAVGQVLNICH